MHCKVPVRPFGLALALVVLAVAGLPSVAAPTRLLRQPAISNDHVAFAYANDIWISSLEGGDARRLTTSQGEEQSPSFSPDGQWVAFSGQYDGNTDVYLLPVNGGTPKRLTWHPADDWPVGWTADGSSVLFASTRINVPLPNPRMFQISKEGGMPRALPMPRFYQGSFNADASWLAYTPIQPWETGWRNYRGGQNRPIWLLRMADYELETIPWTDSNDHNAVWIGETVYFLSDRDLAKNVWAYDRTTRAVRQVTHFRDFDVRSMGAGGGQIVLEYAGYLHLLDPIAGTTHQLDITVRGDLPWARPHWEKVGDQIVNAALSPTGKRAVFEARGEILTVPVEEGNDRNLSRSSGVADRNPVWSPDGASIAWFSDEGGEYALVIADQDGLDKPRRIALDKPTFFFTPAWSPDSKSILFTDEGLNLFYVDVASGKQVRVDGDSYAHPERSMKPVWSPDSRWIAYAKRGPNQYRSIYAYSLDQRTTASITDGMSDATSPAFDRGGKFLYFLASTNYALSSGWLDMSSYEREERSEIYFAVLQADEASPLLAKSDEEELSEPGEKSEKESDKKSGRKGEKDKKSASEQDDEQQAPDVRIDFEGIGQRILSLSVPSRNYLDLFTGNEGEIFYAEGIPNQPGFTLHKYTLSKRKSESFLTGIDAATLSADGKKLLYALKDGWFVVDTAAPPTAGDDRLKTDLSVKVDPRAEWEQIFREAWRYQRDFFYVENVHGADWDWVYSAYQPWVQHVGHRSDLNELLDLLGGETSVGHSFNGGGDTPSIDSVPVGLLGADLVAESGRFKLERIYEGENWNPGLRAPLSAPGLDVREGDFILKVNGVELVAGQNPYSLFEATADRQTVLTISDRPQGGTSREVTVVPVDSEFSLRQRAWIEGNRRKVDAMSGGRLAYVWLPNTGGGGYTNFNRYYFAQQDKQGAVIDERFNTGGSAADYIIDVMARELQGFFNNPVGDHRPFTNPGAGIWGPKVMIINEMAGSGGDLMPWMFRHRRIGPLVGTRTWGGLVGIWDVPNLIDGGFMTAPRGGFYNNDGEWDVENKGVAPDILVEETPREVIAGGDPQLERAVAEALRLLATYRGQPVLPQPADPIRSERPKAP